MVSSRPRREIRAIGFRAEFRVVGDSVAGCRLFFVLGSSILDSFREVNDGRFVFLRCDCKAVFPAVV